MVAKASTKAGEFFCFHCGKQVSQEDYGCRGCGSDFDRIVKAFRCPRCARILPVGAVVCPACGLGFKIRNVSGTKQLTHDEELLVELIDWGKQPGAPSTGSTSSSDPVKENHLSEAIKRTDGSPLQDDVLKSPSEQISSEERDITNANSFAENSACDGVPEVYHTQETGIDEIHSSESTMRHDRSDDSELNTVRSIDGRVKSYERTGPADRADSGYPDISQQPRRPVVGNQVPNSVPMPPQDNSIIHSEGRREGLSNQVLRKMLEERGREVSVLKGREDEIARREAHLERRIRDYATKRRELDNLRKQSISDEHIPHQDYHAGESIDPPDFPSDLAVDDRDSWLKEQTRIKTELIEIRNQMGPKDDMIDYYPPHASGDVLAKIEALEEKIMDISREREEMSARLKRMEACMVDTRDLLRILDQLLGRLPPEVIDEFSRSREFKLYEKVLDDLKI